MKHSGVLHGELSKIIAEIGHGQTLVIADYGLPMPKDVQVIDLAVRRNVPSFTTVLETVLTEFTVQAGYVASELKSQNNELYQTVQTVVSQPLQLCSHEELKERIKLARVIVRTGEWTPYANVILESGVVF